jgi:hypothetical protein
MLSSLTGAHHATQSSAFKFGNGRTEAMLRLQKELLDRCEQASRDWFTRLKSETELWTGLATKLGETRSVPDAIKLYQECILQRVEMAKLSQTHNDFQTSAEPSCKRSTSR